MTADLVIRGARVIDPAQALDFRRDVAIAGGRIRAIAPHLGAGAAEELTAHDCVLAPAFIDAHVHLREPGRPEQETVATGTLAAARGGFGAVACMANTLPPVDTIPALQALLAVLRRDAQVSVWPVAALTCGLEGTRLTDLAGLAGAGAIAFSDDGRNAASPDLLAEGLRRAARCRRPVLVHPEREDLTRGAPVHDGPVAQALGVPGWPRAAEEEAVDIALWALRRAPGARLHLQHLSTAGAVARVRTARAAGLPVTAEATPHHLALTAETVLECGAVAKVNPPLRDTQDTQALVEGLRDGTIDLIATDHAPHHAAAKTALASAAFGIAGLETALALCLRVPVPIARLVEALTVGPSRVLRPEAPLPALRVGEPATCVLFSPEREWTVTPATWTSRGHNTPLMGKRVRGQACLTLVEGRVAHRQELPIA